MTVAIWLIAFLYYHTDWQLNTPELYLYIANFKKTYCVGYIEHYAFEWPMYMCNTNSTPYRFSLDKGTAI